MASVFLSPSLQEFNPYVGEGDEEEYMNRIADAMEPYLAASGIDFGRNSTDQTLAQAIDLSNAGDYDLHLAIHSNAAGPALAGQMRGVDVYYRPGDADSLRAAEQIAADYREIYPDPNAIQILPGLMLITTIRRTPSGSGRTWIPSPAAFPDQWPPIWVYLLWNRQAYSRGKRGLPRKRRGFRIRFPPWPSGAADSRMRSVPEEGKSI